MQKIFSIREALRFGWSQTKKHYMMLCGAVLVVMLVSVFFKILGTTNGIVNLVRTIVNLFIAFGIIRLSLAYAEDTQLSFNQAFVTTKHFGKYLLGCLFVGLAFIVSMIPLIIFIFAWGFGAALMSFNVIHGAGMPISSLVVPIVVFVLLLIPMIMVNIRLKFFPYLILDKGMTAYSAVRGSFAMTKGYTWKLVGFGVVVGVLNIVGLLTIVGVIITLPISFIAMAYIYRRFAIAGTLAKSPVAQTESAPM